MLYVDTKTLPSTELLSSWKNNIDNQMRSATACVQQISQVLCRERFKNVRADTVEDFIGITVLTSGDYLP